MSRMIEDPEAYFTGLKPGLGDQLRRMETQARDEEIPIVGPVFAQMIYLLARTCRAARILELGSAIGYSSIFLASACRLSGGRLITFENDPAMAGRARANLAEAGLEAFAQVRCEDVCVALPELSEIVDMIFIDIDKEAYVHVLPWCKALLADHGLLVADNTGFQDATPFNQALHQDPGWESVQLWTFLPGHSPQNDAFCLAMKTAPAVLKPAANPK